ncbi:unnamed protein product [Mycena citricolor]|uniref:Uncharacterized protein n=1 Tax=Mycena citricolor TaxID=2018698 RepID=A0AAD2HS02_9AGAR|nr:unnamed protein product [Mycena citricolor]
MWWIRVILTGSRPAQRRACVRERAVTMSERVNPASLTANLLTSSPRRTRMTVRDREKTPQSIYKQMYKH